MTADADRTPWSTWTSAERIIALHANTIAVHGGKAGPPDATPCVDGALGAAFNAEAYLEGKKHGKPGLVFAGYLLYSLVQRHCFVDGNKRACWLAAMDALASMGLSINATDDEAIALIEGVISHDVVCGEDVAVWIAPRLYALP